MELSTIQRLGYAGQALPSTTGHAPTRPAAPGAAEPPSQPTATTYARFAVDPDTNRVRVTILDAGTGEVIRRIPIVELADLSAVRVPTAGRLVSSAM